MTTTYAIIENGQPMNGEHLTYDELIDKLPWADYGAEVIAWDYAELLRDQSTPLRLVTEDVTRDWWENHWGNAETMAAIEKGRTVGLAQRYFPGFCASYERQLKRAW